MTAEIPKTQCNQLEQLDIYDLLSLIYERHGGEIVDSDSQRTSQQIDALLRQIDASVRQRQFRDTGFPTRILKLSKVEDENLDHPATQETWQISLDLLEGNPLYAIAQKSGRITQVLFTVTFGRLFNERLTEDMLLKAILKKFCFINGIPLIQFPTLSTSE